jgi:hypothetical protein
MQSLEVADLSKDDRNAVLGSQVGILARVHGAGWANVDADAMRTWIAKSSDALADRWTKAYEAERDRRDAN